jgi:hypothetical protein
MCDLRWPIPAQLHTGHFDSWGIDPDLGEFTVFAVHLFETVKGTIFFGLELLAWLTRESVSA